MPNYFEKYLKKLEEETQYTYDDMWIGGRLKRTYVLDKPIHLRSYDGSKSSNNDEEKHANTECQIMKTFVELTNLTKKYGRTLHFDGAVESNPTLEEDIYRRQNSQKSQYVIY